MKTAAIVAATAVYAATLASARDIPQQLADLQQSILDQGQCNNPLAEGFYATPDDGPNTVYCGDHWTSADSGSIIYLQTGAKLADLDTDCDGLESDPTGQCDYENDPDAQGQTSYGELAKQWGLEADDLTSEVHSYVVLGNEDSDNQNGYKTFDPTKYGVQPGSVVAVLCNKQLHWAVWADTNGSEDGPEALVGEASMALANLCFPDEDLNYNNAHEKLDVLYIAFTGDEALPREGVKWNTDDPNEFEESLDAIGSKLIANLSS